VLFANFGTAALEFEIRVFLADILNGNIVQNDIRFAIFDVFSSEHIEIRRRRAPLSRPGKPRRGRSTTTRWRLSSPTRSSRGRSRDREAKAGEIRAQARKPDPD